MTTMRIDTTKRGIPAIWESGGGLTSGGSSTIIAGREGEKRRPVYVPRGGHLSGGNHALIAVHEGFFIVRAGVSRGTRSSATISRIVSVSVKDIDGVKWDATATVELVNSFSRGEWDSPLDPKFVPAVEAAFAKAGEYHCRSAYYIDTSPKEEVSEAERRRRDEEMRQQDVVRAQLRVAAAERELQAKEQAEAESRAAREGGLGARLEALNVRLAALGHSPIQLNDTTFVSGWTYWEPRSYTESAIVRTEHWVEGLEATATEEERKRVAREAFQHQFEVFVPRAQALGLEIGFLDDRVVFPGQLTGQSYSEEGLATFVADLDLRERKAAEAKAQAEAEAAYQAKKTRAQALGLPTNVSIWCRRGGATNAGDGWVVGPDGQDRGNTTWFNPRPRYPSEGDKIWEQILEGEVVLKWSKAYTAADHEFEIIHLPTDGLTEAQLERICEIEEGLEEEWGGRAGMSGNTTSPSVGKGWGLGPSSEPIEESNTAMAEAMRKAGLLPIPDEGSEEALRSAMDAWADFEVEE